MWQPHTLAGSIKARLTKLPNGQLERIFSLVDTQSVYFATLCPFVNFKISFKILNFKHINFYYYKYYF